MGVFLHLKKRTKEKNFQKQQLQKKRRDLLVGLERRVVLSTSHLDGDASVEEEEGGAGDGVVNNFSIIAPFIRFPLRQAPSSMYVYHRNAILFQELLAI